MSKIDDRKEKFSKTIDNRTEWYEKLTVESNEIGLEGQNTAIKTKFQLVANFIKENFLSFNGDTIFSDSNKTKFSKIIENNVVEKDDTIKEENIKRAEDLWSSFKQMETSIDCYDDFYGFLFGEVSNYYNSHANNFPDI